MCQWIDAVSCDSQFPCPCCPSTPQSVAPASPVAVLCDPESLAVCLGTRRVELSTVQCYLNNCGLTSLIIKMITNSPHHEVFLEAVTLAVGLLNGGNREVQVCVHAHVCVNVCLWKGVVASRNYVCVCVCVCVRACVRACTCTCTCA